MTRSEAIQPTHAAHARWRARARLWAWPAAIGALTASGLASALVSDGAGDWWAWLALGAPVATIAWKALAHGRRG